MNKKLIIGDKEGFEAQAEEFLITIFASTLDQNCGDIEIRIFPKNQPPEQYFCSSTKKAVEIVYELVQRGKDVYFGVNPRMGKQGKKENVHYIAGFHAEIDYGTGGHKKEPSYETYDDALNAIQEFPIEATLVVHSGGGFHCYWVAVMPLKVEEYGVQVLEGINKGLINALGGDPGTQNLDRVLRVLGTYNFKLPDKPRKVELISNTGKKYTYEDLIKLVNKEQSTHATIKDKQLSEPPSLEEKAFWDKAINSLLVSPRIKSLILKGNDGTYSSRSEADMAVVMALVYRGYSEADIRHVFQNYPIGEKYRGHRSPDAYLKHTIKSAKEKTNLTPEESEDPLFLSGSLMKSDKGYSLDLVMFQEYVTREHKIKILDDTFFIYNGQCYESYTREKLNHLCQKSLSTHRKLFTKAKLNDLIHYAVGHVLMDDERAKIDQINYLTLKNGLYSMKDEKLVPHTPNIFTTNLLPYEYDSSAKCPLFRKFLNDVQVADQEKIEFIQEAIGYGFHKSIPLPSIFFLIGEGSNGKSVFINTLTSLFGEENTCSISLNSLSREYYILDLLGKMINISSETPRKKHFNTDIIKAVVGGDWVTGRRPYQQPTKFRPFAKHYLAMNESPLIEDSTHGMWRRIYVIDFPREISEDEMDTGLEEKLKDELSGIFNWAMKGYRRLVRNEFRFKKAKSMEDSKSKYRAESNSVLAFAHNHLKKTDKAAEPVKFSTVFEQYKQFCRSEGYGTPEKKTFFKRILQRADYGIENSKKHSNQLYLFGAELMNIQSL